MPDSLISSVIGEALTMSSMLLCILVSLILGFGSAVVYMVKNTWTKGFVVTLALLPAIVQIVIMMVNGNVGTGVAVAGAFSLVRFRSVPGSARDILSIFFAMAIGLATGMGYLVFAVVFFVIVGAVSVVLVISPFGNASRTSRILRITVPETLDYETIFNVVLDKYTINPSLERVKTSNMGSLFELTYSVELRDCGNSKAFIDELRCLNGNLNISLGRSLPSKEEL